MTNTFKIPQKHKEVMLKQALAPTPEMLAVMSKEDMKKYLEQIEKHKI